MANQANIIYTTGWEDAGLSVLARVRTIAAVNLTQASLNGITAKVYDQDDDNAQEGTTITLTVSSVIFDTLQTDAAWDVDSTGYNFKYTFPASYFPDGGHRYRWVITFDPVSGDDFPLVGTHHAQDPTRAK